MQPQVKQTEELNSKTMDDNKQVNNNVNNEEQKADLQDEKLIYYQPSNEMIEQAKKILEDDKKPVSDFLMSKFEKNAKRNWDIFYKNNKNNFFKDRHYIDREFIEISKIKEDTSDRKYILTELGCGVGNTLLPLVETYQNLICCGFDFSPRAVKIVEEHEVSQKNKRRVIVACADLQLDPIPKEMPSADFATLIFVLSAIDPQEYPQIAKKIYDYMKPGGILFIRDYGRYDMAELRLAGHKNAKIKENFYVRSDGTRAYYFEQEELTSIFVGAGFKELENKNHYRLIENKKLDLKMNRVWVQAKFSKPLNSQDDEKNNKVED